MAEEIKAPKGLALAAVLCSVSLISSILTGIAFLGATFPQLAAWLFGLSIASFGSAVLLGLGIALFAAIEPKGNRHPPS